MACLAAVSALVLLAILRCVSLPRIAAENAGNGLNTVLLLLTAVLLVGLPVLCGVGRQPARALAGSGLKAVAVGALLTGIALLVSSLSARSGWVTEGVLPYPSKILPTSQDQVLLYLLVIFGCIGGAFFVLTAVRWLMTGRTVRGLLRWMAAAPVIWIWIRITRFEVSYVSSLSVYRSLYDVLMLIVEMLFFLRFARFVSGVEDGPPRFFTGISLCTGVLAGLACTTRMVMLIMGNEAAFEACGLVTSADLGVAVLAFSFAFGQAFSPELSKTDIPDREGEAPCETDDESPEDSTESEFYAAAQVRDLLESQLTMNDDEGEEDLPDTPHRPLELEDIEGIYRACY